MFKKVAPLMIVLLVMAVGASSVSAQTTTIDGTFDGQPTMPIVSISIPDCTAQGTIPVRYAAYHFSVATTGIYDFSVSGSGTPGTVASFYLYEHSFNPVDAASCYAASNNGIFTPPATLSVTLTAGQVYILVIIDDTVSQNGTIYSATISGPGKIGLVGADTCINVLPTDAVVYDVPAGAPTFFAPDLASQTDFNLPAGTWKISQFSDDFAKVWIACQAESVWIPTNAIGDPIG